MGHPMGRPMEISMGRLRGRPMGRPMEIAMGQIRNVNTLLQMLGSVLSVGLLKPLREAPPI